MPEVETVEKIASYEHAGHKSSYLYENLPVQTKMAILSRRPILLAISLY